MAANKPERSIAFVEDDESLLGMINTVLPGVLEREGIVEGLQTFDSVSRLREALHDKVLTIACLVTDLTGVGWEMGFVDMMKFRDRTNTQFPIIVSTGMSTEYTNESNHEELLNCDIHILSKPYRLAKLANKVKQAMDMHNAFLRTGVRR